jgi:Polyketide cyclase / dehydrase and lipid transport
VAWVCEESAEVSALPEDAFAAWTDVDVLAGVPDPEFISLEGPFAVGSRLTMKPRGMRKTKLKITRVEPPRVWTNESVGPGFRMVTDHLVEPTAEGVRLTERMEVRGVLSPVLGRLLGDRLRAAARASVDHVAAHVDGAATGRR